MTSLWLRVQTTFPPEATEDNNTTAPPPATTTTTTTTTTTNPPIATPNIAVLPGSSGAGASDIVNAKWMRADPYYVSRLVGTAKGDLRLLSRVMDMRGPTKVYCEGEYFDLLAGAKVQIYTRSDETKPMRWFKGTVKSFFLC